MGIDGGYLAALVSGVIAGGTAGFLIGRYVGRVLSVDTLLRSTDPGLWTAAHVLRRNETRTVVDSPFGYPDPAPRPIVPRAPDDDGEALIPTQDRRRHRQRQANRSARTERTATTKPMG